MTSEWIVVLEATAEGSTARVDEATLSRLIETLADASPVALHSVDRYAVQLRLTAGGPLDALDVALRRWSKAVSSLGAPVWAVVRADVMTLAEFNKELEVEGRIPEDRSWSTGHPFHHGAVVPTAASNILQLRAGEVDLASELRWRLMLQDSRIALILLSAEGNILFSYPPLEPSLVLSKDGASAALADIAYPDDAAVVRDAVAKLASGEADTVTFLSRFRGGDDWRSYEVTARNLLDEPLVRAIVASVEDITERKEAALVHDASRADGPADRA